MMLWEFDKNLEEFVLLCEKIFFGYSCIMLLLLLLLLCLFLLIVGMKNLPKAVVFQS